MKSTEETVKPTEVRGKIGSMSEPTAQTSDTGQMIGFVLRRQRETALMSQADLADRMRALGFKWSQATVWSVESGERQLRVTEAASIGEACGFDPVVFFGSGRTSEDRYAEGIRRGMELSIEAIQNQRGAL